ncbi:DUF1273 domain-containing protein [Ligilactobacillus ceti]|uniref:UPF0398 protein IV53_GL000626 n=1 Tax=Ligilactobacillus ceti DSM 22408 TaxID=1122146 RepID=A0A0R2KMI3_9LACO|nr:DUF1273 domain-containing protein [Ligilactobacillus ceti]KRN88661.1 hypothetical protein IV53_GL000626 [Ligilactobacillus ceti DSM 22408]
MNLWITGYRSYELGVFQNNDPKVAIIKSALKKAIINQIEQGFQWVLTGAQLGIEQWTIEAVLELKPEYPEIKIGVLTPYQAFGSNWQPEKQAHLAQLCSQVDFYEAISQQPYTSPQQFKNYQRFMLEHTSSALLVYDPEYPGKSEYDYRDLQEFSQENDYQLLLIDMYDLQEAAQNFQETD